MTIDELHTYLSKITARALIETGVEGAYDSVAKSTAYSYPSIGCSQWEGSRADRLLNMIPGGSKFVGLSYQEILPNLSELKTLLRSPEGVCAQNNLLAIDCLEYIQDLAPLFSDSKCLVYASTWAPTSLNVVHIFVQNRINWGYNVNNLQSLYELFRDQYYKAADVGDEYKLGYANRARNMYEYLLKLDLWVQ